jgi:hypothetical protein
MISVGPVSASWAISRNLEWILMSQVKIFWRGISQIIMRFILVWDVSLVPPETIMQPIYRSISKGKFGYKM